MIARVVCVILALVALLRQDLSAQPQSLEKFDTLRLENEMTFDVPMERAEEVWTWLTETFGPGFRSHGFVFKTFPEVEEFADTYFDVPELSLIKQGIGVRHRRRFYPNGEIKELIQIKQPHAAVGSGEGNEKQTRGEVKFEPRGPTITYRHTGDFLNEELLRIVRKEHLEPLRARLAEMGVSPERVRPFLAIEQQRRRVYFRENGSQFLTVTLDFANTSKLWVKARFVQLDIEIGEIAFTLADEAKRERLLGVQRDVYNLIKGRFPEIQRNQVPKVVQMVHVVRDQGMLPYLVVRLGWALPLVVALTTLCVLLVWYGRRRGFAGLRSHRATVVQLPVAEPPREVAGL